MPHAAWRVWARMTPPGPAGIRSHPLPPPPPERSVPIPSPFSARDTESRRGHCTDRYKHRCSQRRPQAVPQRDTDTGIHTGLSTFTYTHARTHTHARARAQRNSWAVTTCTDPSGSRPTVSYPAGKANPPVSLSVVLKPDCPSLGPPYRRS